MKSEEPSANQSAIQSPKQNTGFTNSKFSRNNYKGGNMLEANKDARTWATVCHLSALLALVGVPLGNILGPLVIWLIKRNDHSFVDDQGKEAINFQISMTLYGIIAGVLVFFLVGFFLLVAIAIVDLVFVIMAAIKANDGETYRYPLSIRIIQ